MPRVRPAGSVLPVLALFACQPASPEARPADLSPAPVERSATLPNGVRLEYVEQGRPDGIPVVLLHGYTDSRRSWEPVLAHLPEAIRVVAPSQRGHGDSERPLEGYRPEDFAADLNGLFDAVGLESAFVVGHSMGGIIAQRFALDFPRRTRGLVLMATWPTLRGHPDLRAFYDEAVAPLEDPVDEALVREFQVSTLVRPAPASFVDLVVGESLKVPARVWRDALRELLEDDASARLGELAVPTLILHGERDAMVPPAQRDALQRAIRGAALQVIPGAGHGFHWEDPEGFARTLTGFVRSGGARVSD